MAHQNEKWVSVKQQDLIDIRKDMLRYRLMFRILLGYLIFDICLHFELFVQ